jgi:polysaccharide chain length determinant protein (PEP-CTERM system associated)
MHELLERVLEQLRDGWRFRWYGLLVAWVICVVGWALVYGLPNVYKVNSKVQIDTTSVIRPLIKDLTVSPGSKYKVDLLVHTVLSQPNLKKVARNTGLALHAKTPADMQRITDRLGHRIHIRNLHSRINLYRISYSGSDAKKARDIVQSVINIMTGMALGNGVEKSEHAVSFLQGKVDDYHARLKKAQNKLTEFKKKHPELIQGREGYLAQLQTTRAVLAQMQVKLKALSNKQKSLENRVQTLGGKRVAVPPNAAPQIQRIDKQIDQHETNLSQLLTNDTPQNPDVIGQKDIIKRLKKKKKKLMAQLRKDPYRIPGKSSDAYREAKNKLSQTNNQMDALQTSIEQKKLQINVLNGNSGKATGAAAKLANLSSNYNTTNKQYHELLSRLNKAKLSRSVDTLGNPLNFQIIDPPQVPDAPSGPPRILYMLVVLLAGLGGGAIFAFFLSQIRPVFMTRRKLTEVTELPVLGAVSMAWSLRQRVQRRSSLLIFAAAIGALVVCFFIAVVFMPIGLRFVPNIAGHKWL